MVAQQVSTAKAEGKKVEVMAQFTNNVLPASMTTFRTRFLHRWEEEGGKHPTMHGRSARRECRSVVSR